MENERDANTRWAVAWLGSVADGSNTMIQRELTSVEKNGGLDVIEMIAREKDMHLLLLTDDKGDELLTASTKPFKVIC